MRERKTEREKEEGFAEGWAAWVEPYECEGGVKRLQLEPNKVYGSYIPHRKQHKPRRTVRLLREA